MKTKSNKQVAERIEAKKRKALNSFKLRFEKAVKAFKKYLDTYIGDYSELDVERFKRLLNE